MTKKMISTSFIFSALLTTTACEKTNRSFSLLNSNESFQQTAQYTSRKIDILWVVDNSGSMQSSQNNLTANFQSFIQKFQSLNYDFQMAVTSTDAWTALYQNDARYSSILKSLRRGKITGDAGAGWSFSPDSGVSIIDGNTANISQTFLTNAEQGITGTGDERAFSSIKQVLDFNPLFLRADAFLAVIIVSDEDDFSGNTSNFIAGDYNNESNSDPVTLTNTGSNTDLFHLYSDTRLDSVDSYKSYLTSLKGAGQFSVSMIGVLDNACKTQLNTSFGGRRIGRRYMQLAQSTNGAQTSLCGNFGTSLQLISDSIIELSSSFILRREPIPESISVSVNNVAVAQNATNGWTYNNSNWTITFHGTAVPAQGADVQISFQPVRATN